ncbi:chromate transporter [Paenibacillus puerhi]|uniref:chromate transporter n=1 Tax=Paenibacillus puerhi TaxID=2692622 RepID=UPI0013590DA1|nr:chromate transporter [Paenibacillus puerhi]
MNGVSWRLLGQIFWSFFKIGPVTFGGGYAMIPLIEREVVDHRGWVKNKDIADIFAISESIPGAIAINSASFVGFRIAGIPGALAAMSGVLLPTFLIVIGLCIAFLQVQHHPKIEAAFQGIRATTVALIVYAGIKIGKSAVLDKTTMAIVIGTVVAMLFSHMNPIVIILSGAVLGIGLVQLKGMLGMKVDLEKESAEPRYTYTDYYLGDGI